MTQTRSEGSKHAEALELAEAGRHEEALAAVQEHLLRHPLDAEALNDAGALLYKLERLDEAARHLEMALARATGDTSQVLENLVEVYLAAGRGAEAAAMLDKLAGAGRLTADLANRTTAMLLANNDVPKAVEALVRSMELAPQDEHLAAVMTEIRRLRPKVGLFPAPGRARLPDGLSDFIQQRFEARTFQGTDRGALGKFMGWCDVAWFDGVGIEAILASRMQAPRPAVLHVHAHETYNPLLERVNWPGMGLLATSGGRQAEDFLARRLPDVARAGRIRRLPRSVAADKLPFTHRRRGKDLACLGDLSLRRDPMFLLQCFRKLHEADGEFRLFLAGYFQDDMLEAYLRHLLDELHIRGAVSFDGWQEDVPGWLADKHYVVSAGIGPGDDPGAPEAMAMGLKPVLHRFPGAGEIYPDWALFGTDEEFCRRILDEPYDPPACRAFVEQNFAVGKFLAQANELLLQLERLWGSAERPDIPPAARGRPADGLEPAGKATRDAEEQST